MIIQPFPIESIFIYDDKYLQAQHLLDETDHEESTVLDITFEDVDYLCPSESEKVLFYEALEENEMKGILPLIEYEGIKIITFNLN